MAGNERLITEYLFQHIGLIELHHVGLVTEISVPTKHGMLIMQTTGDLLQLSTEDANKKADIYINSRGVSLKQSGANFLFNRLQRADILSVFNMLGFTYANNILSTLDDVIDNFHNGRIKGRSRPWNELFEETHFYKLLEFLMMQGNPHNGESAYPAELILQAPSAGVNVNNIEVFTFDEYFNRFKNNLKIAIRRQWVGQSSDGEHRRAVGLAKKVANSKWVYESIVGSPRQSLSTGLRWREDIAPSERRTVYLVFIEKSR